MASSVEQTIRGIVGKGIETIAAANRRLKDSHQENRFLTGIHAPLQFIETDGCKLLAQDKAQSNSDKDDGDAADKDGRACAARLRSCADHEDAPPVAPAIRGEPGVASPAPGQDLQDA